MKEAFRRSGLQNSRPSVDEFIESLNNDGSLLLNSVEGRRGWKLVSSSHMSQR